MTVTPILTRALRYGAIVAVAVAVLAGGIGLLVSGSPGLLGGLLGAAVSAVFLALTAISILIGGRVTGGNLLNPAFLGIVFGTSLLKFVIFFVAALGLRGQTWMDPAVFVGAVIAAVAGSLVADMLAYQRARVPYVSDVRLPGDETPEDGPGTRR